MSHHEFADLGEIFQGDLNVKPMDGVTSKDFVDLNCNCIQSTTVNGKFTQAVTAGNPLWCEKPLAKNVAAAASATLNKNLKLE